MDYKDIRNKSKWRKKIFFDLYEKIIEEKKIYFKQFYLIESNASLINL